LLSAERHWESREASGEASYGRSLSNYSRTFDPQTGRYLEPDPLSLSGGVNPYNYVAGNPANWIDPLGATKLKFHTSRFLLYIDPETTPLHPYRIPATSGRDECMNQPKCSDEFFRGPIPPGLYALDTRLLSKPGFFARLARNTLGDWGEWRAPLTPAAGTPLPKSRTGNFFLHLGRFPGSAGCIDIGGGLFGNPVTDQVLRDLLSDPDGLVPVEVVP
jgi:RHS repeat-associated protein